MNIQEINNAIVALQRAAWDLENEYMENGGEVTENTEQIEQQMDVIRELLTTEGVDSLGRWLKSKQDEIATAKAEKQAAEQRIRSLQRTEEYIKDRIGQLLRATDTEKVKGIYYSFAQAVSTKNSVNTEAINDSYLNVVKEVVRQAGLPDYIDVELKTTATRLKEAGEDAACYLVETTTDTIRFTKPRAAKEA